ncbi:MULTISPECIES: stage III sporulation protein AE [unclassified Ruminococcus]|uniref:stage III sporulation protein AE n=1 Tax=unclassified Ruminococcus TaxID=2608920 RepID=UPI00210E37C4|nr:MULTISPECIES: stage III sporulation protein AE [unclassified Ruminococcus]MCQ4022087.1 hypothetical protein [Ruminococcus sp. zg-924]MCQ4114407.1 hypothetical protein [Ruminococcus sp. zg-921]
MKRILIFVFSLLIVAASITSANAAEISEDLQDYYSSQLEQSGADDLYYSLSDEAKNTLQDIGIDSPDWRQLNNLSVGSLLLEILNLLGQSSFQPIACMLAVLGIIIFCALSDCLKGTGGLSPLDGTASIITALCLCSVIVFPVADTLSVGVTAIQNGAAFMLLYVPIMAGILVASGSSITGASYYTTVMASGEVISQIGSKLLSPILNMLLGITVVSSLCSKIKLNGIISLAHSAFKWVISFMMSIFVSVISLQSFIGTAADNTGIKAAKFAISSFVPVVGGALSDAFLTVQGSLKLLKSGVGVFAILGTTALYLPAILKCVVWLFTISCCAAFAEVFSLGAPQALLCGVKKVVTLLLVLLLCCMTVMIISTAILLILGGS